jgi:hypothetical protein
MKSPVMSFAKGSALPIASLFRVWFIALFACTGAFGQEATSSLSSDDAYIRGQNGGWVMGTATVENTVVVQNGRFVLGSFKNRISGRDMVPAGLALDELFKSVVGVRGEGPWKLESARVDKLNQGELHLELKFSRGQIAVTKNYMIYPRTSVIREWMTIKNTGEASLRLIEPRFLNAAARLGAGPGTLDFHWMTGAENQPGCRVLKTEHLAPESARRFDSYDPFPAADGRSPGGDGVDARITLNDKLVWPAHGWQHSRGMDDRVPFDLRIDVAGGDRIRFQVNKHGDIAFDTTQFDPTIAYDGGETHVASREFSGQQGRSGWRYGYLEKGRWRDLTYSEDARA